LLTWAKQRQKELELLTLGAGDGVAQPHLAASQMNNLLTDG